MYLLIILIGIIISLLLINYCKTGPKLNQCDLEGKVILITGASSGVGKIVAQILASHKAKIVFACNNYTKIQPIMQQIQQTTQNNDLHILQLDLSDYDNVKQFVHQFRQLFSRIDILINNASIVKFDLQFNRCKHEMAMATNYLGHFLLTQQLLDIMSPKSRIINVSSGAYQLINTQFNWEDAIVGKKGAGLQAYAYSKLANILYSKWLQDQIDQQQLDCKTISIYPGFVKMEILKVLKDYQISNTLRLIFRICLFFGQFMLLTEEQGAQAIIYAALQDFNKLSPGGFYQKNKLCQINQFAQNCPLQPLIVLTQAITNTI